MKGTFEELSDEERSLASTRARADYTINSALEWIGRFHTQVPATVISRLRHRIRELTGAMQGRSVKTIEDRLNALLETQSSMLLLGGQKQEPSSSAVPRIHQDWSFREHRFARGTQELIEARKGRSVFVSYSRADSAFMSRVLVHLRPLERSGKIEIWHDGKLVPGRPWRSDLDQALMHASAAVLIVSANFMASDFIYSNELQPIARRARDDGVAVFPVVFGHCLIDDDPHLGDFQLFNDPERPLSYLPPAEADAVLVKLAKALREHT
jgi:hypothetical protein